MRAFTMITAALLLTVQAAAAPLRIDITKGWRLQHERAVDAGADHLSAPGFDASSWRPAVVPGTILKSLTAAGVYPAPYFGLNITEIPGYTEDMLLAMPEDSDFRGAWWYRTTFTAPPRGNAQFATLHLDGINYEADVWLNGKQIATSSEVRGMFRRFSFPVSDSLAWGDENALAVRVTGPGQMPPRDYGTKQMEATTGWDDHNPWPPDLNTGLWEDVYVDIHGPVTVRDPYAETDLAMPAMDEAKVSISAWLTNHSDATVHGELQAQFGEATVQQPFSLEAGETREVMVSPADFPQLIIANPRLWWPVHLGEPALYDVALTARVDGENSDEVAWRCGVRHVTTFINEEDWRVYEINGRKVLIRGGAWMTSDMMLDLTKERYEALIRYARDAGFNMLRSEGFSIRETDEFYRLCDEYGVMVTQQIFGRSIADEDLAIACIEDMMLRIRKYASLVHFLGHDETHPTDSLNKAYQDLITKHRVARTYQPHSGTFFVPQRAETGGTRTGTRELWTYAGPEHYYRRKHDGAWGFAQSGGIGGIVAVQDSIEAMLPPEQRWPVLETRGWSLHSVVQGGEYFAAFTKAMDASYGKPDDLDDFLRKAYAMNYNSARGMYEAYGRNKYDASGLTTWKYNAAWPAAMTWQYVDWYLRPTAAYYGAQVACRPLHVQFAYDDRGVWVINGRSDSHDALTAKAVVHDFDLNPLFEQSAEVAVGPDGKVKAFDVPEPGEWSTTHFLTLTLTDTAGGLVSDNFYWLSTTPDVPGRNGYKDDGVFHTEPRSIADFTPLENLAPAQIEAVQERAAQETRVTLRNTGNTLAFLVWADLVDGNGESIAPVYWDANCVSLLPGASRTLTAETPHVENTRLRIQGWNVPKQLME
jgi:exo-1,4-beta-D-glucosaminidase